VVVLELELDLIPIQALTIHKLRFMEMAVVLPLQEIVITTSGKLTDAISPSTNFNFNLLVNVMNYSNATTYKTFLARGNIAAGGTEAVVGLWRNTAAITSLELLPTASTFATGSTFTLYGIKAE
jgi:hypothetical protein